ncbi:unnamed protein product [Bursaphelenchus okinawaensis]|uniref:Uncharacterized protein n=1 Tax=Bursaphelenchus okinawaensis TaxID=465554 RepID=A0A811KBQ1_9BILA|nr:unnamed protein product [Bursaphelenchus okinawaensis]CAG9097124.1 unnamed protein product [Bursaphelenchus okinawaensis]
MFHIIMAILYSGMAALTYLSTWGPPSNYPRVPLTTGRKIGNMVLGFFYLLTTLATVQSTGVFIVLEPVVCVLILFVSIAFCGHVAWRGAQDSTQVVYNIVEQTVTVV